MESAITFKLPLEGDDWHEVNPQSIQLLLERTEVRLAESNSYYHQLYGKVMQYIGILTPVAAGMIYLLYANDTDPNVSLSRPYSTLFLILFTCSVYCLLRLTFLVIPNTVHVPGMRPDNYGVTGYLMPSEEWSPDKQFLMMQLCYIENMQDGIDTNENIIAVLQGRLTHVYKTITVVFCLAALAFVVLVYLV